jgi:hypothetical protein
MGMQLGYELAAQTWKCSIDMGMQQGCGHAACPRARSMNMVMDADKDVDMDRETDMTAWSGC